MTFARHAALVALALATGCSSYKAEPEPPPEGEGGAPWPGPYGSTIGAHVRDAKFRGYATYTSTALVDVALHDFYDPTAASPKKLLFVGAGSLWCAPCREEAKELPAVATKLAAQVAFVDVVIDGSDPGTDATADEVAAWTQTFEMPFFAGLDPAHAMLAYFDRTSVPFSMVVDTRTMQIVAAANQKPADIEAYIASHL